MNLNNLTLLNFICMWMQHKSFSSVVLFLKIFFFCLVYLWQTDLQFLYEAEIICWPYLTLYIFNSVFHRFFSSISAMQKYYLNLLWNGSVCLIFCSKIHLIAGIFTNEQRQRALFHGMAVQLAQIVFLF